MRTIGLSCAVAIAFAGIVSATNAGAWSLESGRCAQLFPRNMTVYLPCAGVDELSGATVLSPSCSPQGGRSRLHARPVLAEAIT